MHGVIRQYKVDPSQVEEIISRARTGFVPLVSSAPGFVSYTIADAGTAGLITVSTFEDQAGADESVRMAASWIKNNLAALLPDPPQVTSGQFTIRTVKENGQFGYGVMRRYKFDPGDVEELTRRVREGLVPLITGLPGFASYSVLDAGDGKVVSLSAFADRASAEASNTRSLEWVKDNLGGFVPNPPEVITAEIKVRTARAATVTR